MRFSEFKGNEAVKAALTGMVDSGRVSHAIMLHEDDGGGGVALALAFLQYLFCLDHRGEDSCGECPTCNKVGKLIHPDIHFVFPVNTGTSTPLLKQWRELVLSDPYFTEGDLTEALGIEGKTSVIAVSQAKEILEILGLSALEGGYRAVLVYLPEKMNKEAGNRLLKMMEEPPALTQFILVTHAPEKVLDTIRSRCQNIRVFPFPGAARGAARQEEGYREQFASLMEALLSKDLASALDTGETLAALPSRESAKAFCTFAAGSMREIFLRQQGRGELSGSPADPALDRWAASCKKTFPRSALGCLDRTRMLIERNVNLKLVFTDLVDRLFLNV